MAPIHVVFLQGMPSSFFRRVGEELASRACRVTRINLCMGDWLFWSGPNAISYRGRPSDWERYIGTFFDQNGVTDLVLLGEQRRYHTEAVRLAHARGIRVVVNDFGYLRPDWMTLEPDGMGGNSRFPRNPQAILERSASLANADLTPKYTDSAFRMACNDLLYNFSNLLLGLLYPHYRRTDNRAPTLIYTWGSAKHLAVARLRRNHNQRVVESLIQRGARYFVLPLQLDHDSQIVAYSPFTGMADVIRLVIGSFSQFAHSDQRLVIKVHPWDAGLVNWRKCVRRIADEFSLADRVDYLDAGNLDELARHAQGMVTVNSTSGLHALQVNCPVIVLGQAVYDVDGLTFQGELDAFWTAPTRPDPDLLRAFINLMADDIQIRGVFFREPGCAAAVHAAVQKLALGFLS